MLVGLGLSLLLNIILVGIVWLTVRNKTLREDKKPTHQVSGGGPSTPPHNKRAEALRQARGTSRSPTTSGRQVQRYRSTPKRAIHPKDKKRSQLNVPQRQPSRIEREHRQLLKGLQAQRKRQIDLELKRWQDERRDQYIPWEDF